jgi:hypothetical protein
MDLVQVLGEAQDEVLREATAALERSHLVHYEESGPEESSRRLHGLYTLVVECIRERRLGPMTDYASELASERRRAGFDIAEVQTAFNVLEEAMWRVVIAGLPPVDLPEATGLISTVLGAGKDTLARTWVSLASSHQVHSLDLTALFGGASS